MSEQVQRLEQQNSSSLTETTTTPASRGVHLTTLYQEVCTNIRTSDDISFKLLGFVPLLSGAGSVILSWSNTSSNKLAVVVASLVGAMFTFGLFKWELRNVQKCDVLNQQAAAIEEALLNANHSPASLWRLGQYVAWKSAIRPPVLGPLPNKRSKRIPIWLRLRIKRDLREAKHQAKRKGTLLHPWNTLLLRAVLFWNRLRIGKTQAERIIYWASIAAWLVPILIAIKGK